MLATKRAFTLIELLVVIAIIAILAAILFPVFAQAKESAKKTTELAHFKQIGTAVQMYLADYDDTFMLSNSGGTYPQVPGWGFGPPDKVPGQVLFPYVKNTTIYVGAKDPFTETARLQDHASMMGWNVNALTEDQRLYALMARANAGYNYAFFSPWRYISSTNYVGSGSISSSEIQGGTSSTLLFATSIWDRTSGGGPTGGGNWVIETPCWQDKNGKLLEPMARYDADGTLQSYAGGWARNANSWLVYGGIWPFWNQTSLSSIAPGLMDGRAVTVMADSSAKSLTINRIKDGCDAYGTTTRGGTVTDSDKFLWDLL